MSVGDGADGRLLRQLMYEWDHHAQAVGDANPVALRGSGASTFLAGGFDQVYALECEAEIDFVSRVLNVGPRETVLEVGCGNCVFLAGLARQAKAAVGVDISAMMLRHGQQYLRGRGGPGNAHLSQAAMQSLPFRDGAFEKVLANSCLQYVPPTEVGRVLAELARVKVPPGLILLSAVPSSTSFAGRREWAIQILRNAWRRWQRRPPVLYWRLSAGTLRRFVRQAGLEIVTEGTMKYNFYPLPRPVRAWVRAYYSRHQRPSYWFGSRHFLLCR